MRKDDAFIKKIDEYLKKDIDGFIKAVNAEFNSNPFTIYGLNVSVYLLKSERNSSNEEVYEIYSLDCSQNMAYYNSIWNKYLEIYENKFSHFEFDRHTDKGWYDKDVIFQNVEMKTNSFKDLNKLIKIDKVVLSDVEIEERPNTEAHFINADDGWIKFISELKTHGIERAFNLSWVSSYIHIPNSEFLDYPKWYVSCYLLVDLGKKISDKRFYKRAFRPAISKLLFNTSLSFHELLIENKQVDLELQATRAAISQVMARNTSHNIGAHVMNKLIGDLNYDTLFKKKNYNSVELITLYTETINKWNQDRLKDNKPELTEEEQKQKILLDQISIFNNYVKCRMDYLADISFGTPLMQTNKYAFADLFKELDKVRLLLEHISGLDNFKFEIKFTRNGKEFKKDNQGEGEDDLLVAIPNDILGTQAFYNILENIIRNSAKHSDKSKLGEKENVVFAVNFIDNVEKVDGYCNDEKCDRTQCNKAHKNEIENSLNEFIVVEVYDNIPVDSTVNPIPLEKKEIDEFKRMMGNKEPKFETYIDYLVFKQNNKLNEDILQENKLRSYSLGLVEMDASAAYLRKRPVEFINHRSYDIQYDESWSRNTEKNKEEGRDQITHRGTNCRHFLKAFKKTVRLTDESKKGKTENYLGYRFFLHRPAVVLVVTKLLKDDIEKKDKLRKEGIWLIEPIDFEKDLKEGKVFPHEFVIHTGLQDCETVIKNEEPKVNLLEHYKTSLPIRILELKDEKLKEILGEEPEKIVCDCWIRWEQKLKTMYQVDEFDMGSSINPRFKGFQAVFLDHLNSNNQSDNKSVNSWRKNLAANHLEALSSIAQSKMPDYHNATNDLNVQLHKLFDYYVGGLNTSGVTKSKLAEAVFCKVIVIDERIQEAAEKRDFMSVSFKCLYSKMNVRVPDKSINLSANSYTDSIIADIERYIESQIQSALPTDFILIHFSIFERMYPKDKIRENLKRLIGNSPINIVFTSGRGTPDNLGEDVRFVNLSSVISAFVDIRSKYTINYLLFSTRKSKIS